LVREHTKIGEIKNPTEIYEINENTLKIIEKSKISEIEKIFNILRGIENTIKTKGEEEPYLISIAEKAESIMQMFKERQKTTKETLDELKKIIMEFNTAQKERAEKGMNPEIFLVYWIFKQNGFKEPERMAEEMEKIFEKFPHWKSSEKQEKEIRTELYGIILRYGFENLDEANKIVEDILKKLKIERVL
ncbi:MAG: type I restriction endonuclease subunit R, partial [Thermoanaerobaculia bacterium]